eukprot:CAMPEP_0206133554 /NCGR_PEP_ID=MMETSP1472-20131121/53849_1 /ASSEMBLY_ACC=CAM_ASM_001108 /TAXON_ID=41880 /ORGANISM="Pycnococcus provasolii, Strain RCC251" /LENGTH=64 /DNA_ID=CAMNT_0053525127 /DNA_START=137 /DNA_END=328 /DNA_ORIENTATION=-
MPYTTVETSIAKNVRKIVLDDAAIGKVPKNVVKTPNAIGLPMPFIANTMRSSRLNSGGVDMKAW